MCTHFTYDVFELFWVTAVHPARPSTPASRASCHTPHLRPSSLCTPQLSQFSVLSFQIRRVLSIPAMDDLCHLFDYSLQIIFKEFMNSYVLRRNFFKIGKYCLVSGGIIINERTLYLVETLV